MACHKQRSCRAWKCRKRGENRQNHFAIKIFSLLMTSIDLSMLKPNSWVSAARIGSTHHLHRVYAKVQRECKYFGSKEKFLRRIIESIMK